MTLNCIIIDDEPRAIAILREYVEKVPGLHLSGTFRDSVKALTYLNSNKVHLVFLDINMPNLSGIQFVKSLVEKPFIILTTAYSEYAVESYQLDVDDYLLKPIEFDRFMRSINKIWAKVNTSSLDRLEQSMDATVPPSENKAYIFVKNGIKIERVDIDDIQYIAGSGNYIVYQLAHKKVMALGKMSEVLDQLPEDKFVRIHKSHIVQLSRIKSIEDNHVLVGDAKLSISNTYRTGFYNKINP
ncbi:LytR/AlgR family response regulator transcription factor [Allomuricauda sp. AC10]|nr:response regulator [Muricauda sp. AC10]MDC6366979.1 response regulator [Muricauda sp. AC10]